MERLLTQLIEKGYVQTPALREALQRVPRAAFLPHDHRQHEEEDRPIPIGYGQTNSQPMTVAFMLELLQPKPGERVLDVGAGSGWTAALFSQMVGPEGRVIAVERIPQLARLAEANLRAAGFDRVEVVHADGSRGYKRRAPYDIIHVAAAASGEVPKALKEQLAVGGRLLLPVGQHEQTMLLLKRLHANEWWEQRIPGFSFVPLVEDARA